MEISLKEPEIGLLAEAGYFIRDGFLGETLALDTAGEMARMLDRGELKMGHLSRGAGKRLEPATRNDRITWLDPENCSNNLQSVFEAFQALRLCLNETFYLGLQSFEVQLACYPGGGSRYARHLDAFPGSVNRKVTSICYLNPEWRPEHGGMLRLYIGDGVRDVEPRLDRLVVFLSDQVEHEVMPTFALRRAITAWYRQRSVLPISA